MADHTEDGSRWLCKLLVCAIHYTEDAIQTTHVSLEHKTSLKSLGCICSNSQQYTVWVRIIDFYLCQKIIRILRSCSMKIFCRFPP